MQYHHYHQLKPLLDSLKTELRIAIICSGDPRVAGANFYQTYNERHWKSYAAVADDLKRTLEEAGFRHVVVLADDSSLPNRLAAHRIHLAWLNTAGMQGRNAMAHTAGLLESLGIAYVGHSPMNYALMDHKLNLKRMLGGFGIATPDWLTWHPEHAPDKSDFAQRFRQFAEGDPGPWVVKPVSGRASWYIHVVNDFNELWDAVHSVYRQTFNQVLIERFLDGPEYCVSVGPALIHRNQTFERGPEPLAFSFLQRLFQQDERIFQSIDHAPLNRKRTRLIQPTEEPKLVQHLAQIGRRLYRELNLNYLIRVDLRAAKDGTVQVLEVNPKPDLKRPDEGGTSLVSMGLGQQNMDYGDLVQSLLGAYLDSNLIHRPKALAGLAEPLAKVSLRPPVRLVSSAEGF
ncbi:hypothetical protein [Acanthopleuribacter pedis]|uniref:ATP-grasp domain-containing protein n=1 Tax=Acanthopleuribacter pedis TaxID=442870 RepID=A0A8J7QLD8_9BACT|nr:hypothetical protein [Acanthopleuribacter pedis]MBO1323246.1 hypothetical protein [Acanthopleuribacter pedis]